MTGPEAAGRALAVPAALLAVLAGLSLFKARWILQWQLTILATEFGHWLALGSFALLAAGLTFGARGTLAKPALVLLAVAALVYLRPLAQAFRLEPVIREGLSVFSSGLGGGGPMISWSTLFLGRGERRPAPERITYKGGALTFDFYRPAPGPPAPWVMVVHGGGWNGGAPSQVPELNRHLAARGYAVAAISYRLAPEFRWPAQRDDAVDAARFIRAHARELNIDPDRWVVLGRSAGGQIAEAVALAEPPPGLRGCVSFYGPADLNFAYRFSEDDDLLNSRKLLRDLLGGTPEQAPALYHDASPYDFAGSGSLPLLLFHGRNDALTWHKQSERLFDKMRAAGARAAFVSLPWATHGFDYTLNGPGGQISTFCVDRFLEAILGRPEISRRNS